MVGNFEVRKAKEVVRRRLSLGTKDNSSESAPDLESCTSERKSLNGSPSQTGKDVPRYVPMDWDDSLPYGGKVYLARQKKPESWLCIILQVFLVLFAVGLLYFGWYYTEHLHYHTAKLFASFGHKEAQAIIGHKLLHGKGVEQNQTEAMKWLHGAAKQGHPHAAYNVAIGHLQGLPTDLKPGEAKDYIKHAAENGVEEAIEVFEKICSKGKCDI